jgi:hypothetical protein
LFQMKVCRVIEWKEKENSRAQRNMYVLWEHECGYA